MTELILSVWAEGDDPGDSAPISLLRPDGTVVASHDTGFDLQPFIRDEVEVDPGSAFSASGRLDTSMQHYLGEELWRRVAPADIATALEPMISDVLVYLDLRSVSLLKLPWELLRCRDTFVFAREQARFCLGRPSRRDVGLFESPPAIEQPARMMIIIGSKPNDTNILADDELACIEQRAHAKNADFLLKVLIRPSTSDIVNGLVTFRPHILHFIGHGNVDAADVPIIEVWSEADQRNEIWTTDNIVDEFSRSPPQLVVLNACRTASPSDTASFVDAFSRTGCPSVVGMMGDVLGESSLYFSQAFYDALCSGLAIDQACTRARGFLRGHVTGGNTIELRSNWSLLRVLIRGNANELFKMPQPLPGLIRLAEEDFVDRWEQRWEGWRTIIETSSLTMLCGQKDGGKSSLLRAIAQIWCASGRPVILADVSQPPRGGWQDLLNRIVDEGRNMPGINATVLDEALQGDSLSEVMPRFHAALEQCSLGLPLLVAIDGLSEWQQDLIELPSLCEPYLGADSGSQVRMLIALREAPVVAGWGYIPQGWNPIDVGLFSEAEWKRAVRQMASYWHQRINPAHSRHFADYVTQWEAHPNTSASALNLLRGIAMDLSQRS